MSILKRLALIITVAIVAVLLYATTRPDSFQVERSVVIAAKPEKIFPLINDLHQWTAWSPWEHLDPALKREYSGSVSGQGASYAWSGNNKVGSGSMTITASQPATHIAMDLHFIQPFEARNTADFTLTEGANGTRVTWRMAGPNPYIAKVVQIFCSVDAMVGKDFETGLARLRQVAEQ